jgi:Txe/YoeB family toxin of toxin-antitoxin system
MEVVFTKQAIKDFEKIKQNQSLYKKVVMLLDLIKENPLQSPPPYEKLVCFEFVYSRRINIQYRLVYQVYNDEKTVKVIRMWTHYDNIS